MSLRTMIDQMAAVQPPMSAKDAGDRCRDLSYPKDPSKKLEAFGWTTPRYVKLLQTKFPPGFPLDTVCTGDYIGKDGDSVGQHHLHGDSTHLVCCLCGFEWWEVKRSEIQWLRVDLLHLLTNKLLEDELGF